MANRTAPGGGDKQPEQHITVGIDGFELVKCERCGETVEFGVL